MHEDVLSLAFIIGQLDDETTKRVYLHVTKTRKKEACVMFNRLMQDAKKA
ncbi:hypothetical protein [uncultured Selenomonas sp.]|nr:hypothetical protein [uncultured Selenomonas sp.]